MLRQPFCCPPLAGAFPAAAEDTGYIFCDACRPDDGRHDADQHSLLLSGQVIRALKDYETQKKAGKDPEFRAEHIGLDTEKLSFWK